jgi:hypothetical protein
MSLACENPLDDGDPALIESRYEVARDTGSARLERELELNEPGADELLLSEW